MHTESSERVLKGKSKRENTKKNIRKYKEKDIEEKRKNRKYIQKSKGKKVFSTYVRYLVVLWCIFLVFLWARYLLSYIGNTLFSWEGSVSSLHFFAKSVGTPPQLDTEGHINILLVGIGGKEHRWGTLADTIIVASFDTKNNALSMLSIPRDLYIKDGMYQGRINAQFSRWYGRGHKSIASWAQLLTTKVEEIVGFDIPYYVVVDFVGFEKFIDAIWWININVPETLHDTSYPISEEWDGKYWVFYLQAGPHTLDGATALKYARSRHSTSDFSRSLRQQQIIKAVKERILSSDMLDPDTIQKLYFSYKDMVTTNFSLQEMLGMIKHLKKPLVMSNFGLNVSFNTKWFESTEAGSFLYYPDRESFNGAAVILPYGATAGKISFYKYIHWFADLVLHQQRFLREKTPITVKNWIHKDFARTQQVSPSWWANNVAIKLKRYWFLIDNVDNSDIKLTNTTIVLPHVWTGNQNNKVYSWTIQALRMFIPVIDVVHASDTDTWVQHMELILWDNFLQQVAHSGFVYVK